jgi:hypothetical protein
LSRRYNGPFCPQPLAANASAAQIRRKRIKS